MKKESFSPEEKAYLVLEKIRDLCNRGYKNRVSFVADMGENTLTFFLEEGDKYYHNHIGYPGCSFSDLVGGLYNLLILNKGLSWAQEEKIDE